MTQEKSGMARVGTAQKFCIILLFVANEIIVNFQLKFNMKVAKTPEPVLILQYFTIVLCFGIYIFFSENPYLSYGKKRRILPSFNTCFKFFPATFFFVLAMGFGKRATIVLGYACESLIKSIKAPTAALLSYLVFNHTVRLINMVPLGLSVLTWSSALFIDRVNLILFTYATFGCCFMIIRNMFLKRAIVKDQDVSTVKNTHIQCLVNVVFFIFSALCTSAWRYYYHQTAEFDLATGFVALLKQPGLTFSSIFFALISNYLTSFMAKNCSVLAMALATMSESVLTVFIDILKVDIFFFKLMGLNSEVITDLNSITQRFTWPINLKLMTIAVYVLSKVYDEFENRGKKKEVRKRILSSTEDEDLIGSNDLGNIILLSQELVEQRLIIDDIEKGDIEYGTAIKKTNSIITSSRSSKEISTKWADIATKNVEDNEMIHKNIGRNLIKE